MKTVELTTIPGTVKQVRKAAYKAWPDITFNGYPFIHGRESYYEQLDKIARKQSDQLAGAESYQEEYTGWVHNTDMFISVYHAGFEDQTIDDGGWYDDEDDVMEPYDTYETTSIILYLSWRYAPVLKLLKDEDTFEPSFYGGGARSGYKQLHKKYKNLVDLRLD